MHVKPTNAIQSQCSHSHAKHLEGPHVAGQRICYCNSYTKWVWHSYLFYTINLLHNKRIPARLEKYVHIIQDKASPGQLTQKSLYLALLSFLKQKNTVAYVFGGGYNIWMKSKRTGNRTWKNKILVCVDINLPNLVPI